MGVNLFDLFVKLFGLDINPALGQVDWTFFIVYTIEENIDCRKEKSMKAFLRLRADTQIDCTGVDFMGLAKDAF